MPISIHGVSYLTVAERLKTAHGEAPPPEGIERIITDVEAVGSIIVVKATVIFNDKRMFTGHSLVDFQATQPAERDAPLEVAETSAVGRALAMAGYPGSANGLAGAEEMRRVAQAPQREPGVATRGAAAINADSHRPTGGSANSRPALVVHEPWPDDAPHPADAFSGSKPDLQAMSRMGATPKQLETLAKFRVPARDGLTRAEASDLITKAIAAREGAPR